MFITLRRHREELEALRLHYQWSEAQMQLRCKQYESQIDDLRRMVFIPQYDVQPQALEVDAVLDAHEKPVGMTDKERNEYLEASREADLIFAGNHEQGMI